MGIYRLFTGSDGQSHIEEVNLADHPELKEGTDAKNINFQEGPPGRFIDWHPAPRRQYVISLSGQIEIGLGDGTTSRYGPGDARLVEDTTGQGHTTRVIGDQPSITAVSPSSRLGPADGNLGGLVCATSILLLGRFLSKAG